MWVAVFAAKESPDSGQVMLQSIGEHEGCVLLYTAPARVTDTVTDEHFKIFCKLVEPYRNRPWIWVLDGAKMGPKHYTNISYCKKLYLLLAKEHKESLKGVWVLNLNAWIRGMIKLFPTAKPVSCLPTDRLELFVTMQHKGVSSRIVDVLLNALHPGT